MIEVFVADEQDLAVDSAPLIRLAHEVLKEERRSPETEVNVILVGEKAMAELHDRFMGEDGPTDVLAFPLEEDDEAGPGWPPGRFVDAPDEPHLLGDVVICPAVAARQAKAAGWGLDQELKLLLVHGLLHLLGHDHGDADEAASMERLQARYLDAPTS